MQCDKCGHELNEEGKCAYCEGKTAQARVMSPEETESYQGLTIDEDGEQNVSYGSGYAKRSAPRFRATRQSYSSYGRPRVFVRSVNLGNLSENWATKITLALLAAAVVAFILFIALPVAAIGLVIGILVWLILSFVRG